MSDSDKAQRERIDRMVSTGCMWLNSAFRIKAPKKSGGGRFFSFTADASEIVWGLLFAGTVFLIQFTLWNLAGRTSPGLLYLIWSPMSWFFYGAIAFMFGRRMAHISPYRSHTGESATQWASVAGRKSLGRLMSRMGFSNIAYNRVLTVMRDGSDRQFRITMAREWLGIAPAPYAPHVSDPEDRGIHNEIAVSPDGQVYPDMPAPGIPILERIASGEGTSRDVDDLLGASYLEEGTVSSTDREILHMLENQLGEESLGGLRE